MTSPLTLIASQSAQSDAGLLASISTGQVAVAALSSSTPLTVPQYVSDDYFVSSPLASALYNQFFTQVQTDLIRLFAAANANDQTVSALETSGTQALAQVSNALDVVQARLTAATDAQLGYTAGYTIFSRVDFINDAAIERNPAVVGSYPQANYDSQLQSITLGMYLDEDTLHNSDGSIVVDAELDLVLGLTLPQFAHLRTPAHAIDLGSTSYWGEVVLVDDLVQIPWPLPVSDYAPAVDLGVITPLQAGAVCEYTLTYRQPTTWTSLVIKPFCELPINLAVIFVVKRDGNIPNFGETRIGDSSTAGYGIYLITEYASARNNGFLYINETTRLFFPIQEEALSLTIVFHQPHYTREVFSLPLDATYSQALWQQMLGDSPILGAPTLASTPGLDLTSGQPLDLVARLANAIGSNLSGSLTTPASGTQTYSKYQYVYGAYDIEVRERRYSTTSTFISTPITSPYNLMQGTIVADYDLPLISTILAPASAFAGDSSLVPDNFQVPAATLTFDMTFGSGQSYYPFAPLDANMIHEPAELTASTSTLTLRLQARPGTSILLTSFDGQGHATVIGAVVAGNPVDQITPTSVTWPNAILSAPGFYVVSYTPLETSLCVDFGNIAQAANMAVNETVTLTGSDLPQASGVTLPSYPFIDSNRINGTFEPNGNSSISEYVPISIGITGMPISFPNIVNSSGHPTTLSNFAQDIHHTDDLYTSVTVTLETLYSNSSNPNAGTIFTAKNGNWNRDPAYAPQLFAIASGTAPVLIPPTDASGDLVWTADYTTGVIRFEGNNAAVSGQIALTYAYLTDTFASPPVIINRTNFASSVTPALTPFDSTLYPVIEYVVVGNTVYFNCDIPKTATVTINYNRLFDSIRVRATFTRIDPFNESATAHLYGFTLLARDANTTSLPVLAQPEVVWGDLELESLGTITQSNPGIGIVAGNSTSAAGLPSQTQFDWYKIVNSGSVTDTLRAAYDASNGTTVFWDFSGQRSIPADGGVSNGVTYQIMQSDGSNTIRLEPGNSVVVGVANFLVPPGTPNAINAATIYSGQTADYLQTTDWLLQAAQVTVQTSIASVVLS